MRHEGLTAFAVHYVNRKGRVVKISQIKAADYWEACTKALGEGFADFKVFDRTDATAEEATNAAA